MFYLTKKEIVLSLLILLLLGGVIILGFKYDSESNKNKLLENEVASKDITITEYSIKLEELYGEIDFIKEASKDSIKVAISDTEEFIKEEYNSYIKDSTDKESVEDLCKAYLESQLSNNEYIDKINENNLVIEDLVEKIEKYEHYEYALYDTSGKRNDITMQDIELLEQLTIDEPVNDIDLYLSWIMIESEGRANCKNPKSTAKGLSQFLDSTSKNVYKELGFDDAWYPEIVYKKDICLTMMVKYVNDLVRSYNGNLQKAINSYRGFYDAPYMRSFNRYLSNSDKSVESIAEQVSERYYYLKQMEDVAVG